MGAESRPRVQFEYARYYMSPSDPVPRFFSFLLAFMSAMLGIVLYKLIQLVFFWAEVIPT